jgi:uncharacterized protein YbbC (DUF1343 family)
LILLLIHLTRPAGTQAAQHSPPSDPPPLKAAVVATGVDVLRASQFAILRGCRVGLITNHTGQASDGTSTIDLLHSAQNLQLIRIFTPEHGLRGTAENGVFVESGADRKTGLPVVSLYLEKSRQPKSEQLADLDVLVFDVQDCGVRFYTYLSTLFLAMEAASEAGIRFVVLDRPNPIRADRVEGPLPTEHVKPSFTCPYSLPVRHGMTVGELAHLYQAEAATNSGLHGLELHVIRMAGYRRDMWFDETGLTWPHPSPNLPSLSCATLYPGIGMLEFLNISVGRGTDAPFLTVGAPYLDANGLAQHLTDSDLPGIRCQAVAFTPGKSVFSGHPCHGIRIHITDRDLCMPLDVGLAVATYLAREHGEASHFRQKADTLLRHPRTIAAILRGEPAISWQEDLTAFQKRRAGSLLYR